MPMKAEYQVLRVARVLSMGLFYTDVQGVPKKAVKSNPGKILRKCNFNFFNVKNWPFFPVFEPFLPFNSILLILGT